MTPQLQQAIRLLQLSSVELQQEIQEILETNPLLERVDDSLSLGDSSATVESIESKENKTKTEDVHATGSSIDNIPEDMNLDADWDEIYDPSWKTTQQNDKSTSDFIETMHSETQGLRDHLDWQIQMSNLTVQDKAIASLIIDYIDDDGFLTEPLEHIFDNLSKTLLIEFDEVEAMLNYIQHLDPPGIAARNLGECLILQVKQLHKNHPLFKKTLRLLEKHLDLIEKKDYTGIKRSLKINNTVLEQLMTLIRSLEPRPGKVFSTIRTDYITPDIYVRKVSSNGRTDSFSDIENNNADTQGKWKISLNSETQPALQINNYYANMLTSASLTNTTTTTTATTATTTTAANAKPSALQQKKIEETNYIKDNLQQARWFIKSLENRNSTIVNVAQAIIERQSAFFQYGEEAMKPMVLKDLADQLGLHESTISRVTTRKYMHTPRGVFEFKYFFSSHVGTETGGECSATAIRAMIKKLISNEDPGKPLSDNKLTNLLKQQGINVARRTVAKYREALMIPSSHDRKVFV